MMQEKYNFKAKVFHAKDLPDKNAYQAAHGSDLFIRDIDEYDRICKVSAHIRLLALHAVDAAVHCTGNRVWGTLLCGSLSANLFGRAALLVSEAASVLPLLTSTEVLA